MDLSYLYHRHGVSLVMAEHAACDRARDAHHFLAAAYAERIADAVRQNREALA
jgi:hypothetical protein